ncbi:MAG: STAS domain-containing protein [bacterium]|nr:STAS domain-containing protein [bacterium]
MFETQREGDVVILAPKDKMGGKNLKRAEQQVDELLEAGVSRLALDFSGVEYIDSSGIGVLVRVLRKAKELGGGVALFGMSENVYTIFEITMLHEVFTIVVDRKSAIEALT